MTTRGATPLVQAEASRLGVDLATVNGTGVGGRVRLADVQNAAGRRGGPARNAITNRPRLMIEVSSRYTREMAKTVNVDVFAENPLYDELAATDPQIEAKARSRGAGPVPQLFTAGPVPAFTTSGIDPAVLMQVPYVVRPTLARVSRDTALQLVEAYGVADEATWLDALREFRSDPIVSVYQSRMHAWWLAATTHPPLRLSDLGPRKQELLEVRRPGSLDRTR